jgi:Short C-terminal domain
MPGLMRGVARVAVAAGTATAVSNRVSRRQGRRWAEQDSPPQEQSYEPEPAQAPPPDAEDPRITQLEQLAELKGRGVLTDEEFAAEKARVLG